MKKPKAVFIEGNILITILERGAYSRSFYKKEEMDAFHYKVKKRLVDALIVAGKGKAGGLFALKEAIWDVCKELEKEAKN